MYYSLLFLKLFETFYVDFSFTNDTNRIDQITIFAQEHDDDFISSYSYNNGSMYNKHVCSTQKLQIKWCGCLLTKYQKNLIFFCNRYAIDFTFW